MSFILRGIGKKALWFKEQSDFPWLPVGELVADVFKTIATGDGCLSTYAVDEEKSNLKRVIAALACTRDSVQRYDYVLVPRNIIEDSFELRESAGKTADEAVNQIHLDIVHLTPAKLSELAYIFRDQSIGRLLKKEVDSEIRDWCGVY